MKRKIKIIFLHWRLVCGGAESALLDLIRLLDKNIFDITVLAMYGGGEWVDRFRDTGVTVIDSYSCVTPSKNPLKKVRNLFKSNQIKFILSHGGKGLLKACTSDDFDLVVSYHLNPGLMAAGFSDTAKTIRYIHGDAETNPALQQQIQTLRQYHYCYDKIICVSECAKKSFIKYYGKSENVVACHNPIDSSKILILAAECPALRITGDYICAVGRLVEAKGYLRLVRIFASLIDQGINTKLLIIGEGPERESIEKNIKEYHMEDHIILTGYLPNPYPYMKNARFCVCSSYTEGLHIASMESLLLGVPVVSIFPTVAELLGNELCGIVADSEASFADALKKMLTDHELYKTAKAAAVRRSKAFYSKSMVQKITSEYIDTLTNSYE